MQPAPFSANPLRRPFPDRAFGRSTFIGHARVALFIAAALYFLQPIGLVYGDFDLVKCVGYGLVTFTISITYSYVTDRLLGWKRSGTSWTLGKWILDSALLLFFISVGNFLFHNLLVNWSVFSARVLFYITIPTVLIGLFPIAFSGMAVQLRAERDNQRSASGLTRLAGRFANTSLTPVPMALADGLSLDPAHLLFCERRGASLRVVFLREARVAEQTILSTLERVETALNGTSVVSCHPDYLVNVDHVRSARGNAQGLRLNMHALTEEVPVSHDYVAAVREQVLA